MDLNTHYVQISPKGQVVPPKNEVGFLPTIHPVARSTLNNQTTKATVVIHRLTGAVLTRAGYNARTCWPAGFDPLKHGAVLEKSRVMKRTTRTAWWLSAILAEALLVGFALLGVQLRPYWVAKYHGQRADLHGAVLILAPLGGADLRWANLTGADLAGANLAGAKLSGADLKNVNLCGACLRGTDLIIAGLEYADLRGADLRKAQLLDP